MGLFKELRESCTDVVETTQSTAIPPKRDYMGQRPRGPRDWRRRVRESEEDLDYTPPTESVEEAPVEDPVPQEEPSVDIDPVEVGQPALNHFLTEAGYEVDTRFYDDWNMELTFVKKDGQCLSFTTDVCPVSKVGAFLIRTYPENVVLGSVASDESMAEWFERIKGQIDGAFAGGKAVDPCQEDPAEATPETPQAEAPAEDPSEPLNEEGEEIPAEGLTPTTPDPTEQPPADESGKAIEPLEIKIVCPECQVETTLKDCIPDGSRVLCPECGAVVDSFEVPGETQIETPEETPPPVTEE